MNNVKNLWAVTDGSQGMISQVNGLAKYIEINFQEKKVELKWPWSILPPGFLPISKYIFKSKFHRKNFPDIIITCGRKSIYASLFLKKLLRDKIISIHIQNPKINNNNFDFIISPNHDQYCGKNVINSIGALHNIDIEKINNAKRLFDVPDNKKIVTVILGGENNHYYFDNLIFNKLISKISSLNDINNKFFFLFIPSRRTPQKIINGINNNIKKNCYIWNNKDENPYLYSLKIADYFIVTSDSTSMISEVSITGKPVFVFHLPFKRKSIRFENFHKEFKEKGITRPFKNNIYNWTYEPINESKRIAGIINTRILEYKNE